MPARSSVSRRSRRSRRPLRTMLSVFLVMLLAGVLCIGWTMVELNDTESNYDSLLNDPAKGTNQPDILRVPELSDPTESEVLAEQPWNLVLVNRENPLPEDFTAPALTQLRNNQAIDSRAYPTLQAMMDAARAEGLQPLICSSFRTWETQEKLYLDEVNRMLSRGYSQQEAEEQAAIWVAIPGTSEHQLGLAVDIVDMSYQLLDKQQENTPVQRWLMEHCAEYGFILRYPTDKSEATGIGYEPWHYRYVGVEAAKEIMESGLCLEEYLELIQS